MGALMRPVKGTHEGCPYNTLSPTMRSEAKLIAGPR